MVNECGELSPAGLLCVMHGSLEIRADIYRAVKLGSVDNARICTARQLSVDSSLAHSLCLPCRRVPCDLVQCGRSYDPRRPERTGEQLPGIGEAARHADPENVGSCR